jgi:hypothetical protein
MRGLFLLVVAAFCISPAYAEEPGEEDRVFTLELGGAGEQDLSGGGFNFGPNIAGEITPIENWLELELGFSALPTSGHTELSWDFLFKKPFTLSPTTEVMIGAGPSLSRTLSGPDKGTVIAPEVAVDFMFWPTSKVGWYVEPSWSIVPGSGKQSATITAGLLISFP